MSTIEDRFKAAVNVIRGLPKNGSYQPSNDMMLKFYSYFKQATNGPCNQKKPAFWDVVNRAKYDAWKSLGNMSKTKAMENYVDELKKIIETMSYTDNVANFMGSISELDGINVDDLEAVAPEAIKKVKSQPNSPFASREASPIRIDSDIKITHVNGIVNGSSDNHINRNGKYSGQKNGNYVEHSDDEYIDTVDDESEIMSFRNRNGNAQHHSRSKVRSNNANDISGHNVTSFNPTLEKHSNRTEYYTIINTLTQINSTVQQMNQDLAILTKRLNNIETTKRDQSNVLAKYTKKSYPKWWPFEDISPNWFLFLILWPIIAQNFFSMFRKKKV